jgi:hypothetical protein
VLILATFPPNVEPTKELGLTSNLAPSVHMITGKVRQVFTSSNLPYNNHYNHYDYCVYYYLAFTYLL